MNLPVWPQDHFQKLVTQNIEILDVRAPIEFQAGALPNSFNEPILNDLERHEIGTIYKTMGSDAAVARGYALVSGSVKEERVQKWKQKLEANPGAIITCFRGGQRSQITQKWLLEVGLERPRIDGGYKAYRNFLIQELDRLAELPKIVISGTTGSGKTLVVRKTLEFRPTLDLEAFANHRGSAFGGYPEGQPSQVSFENQLAAELIRIEQKRSPWAIVVEDESRLIGRCAQPEKFFESLRQAPIVFVEEPLSSRVKITFEDYILNSPMGSGDPEKGLETFRRYRRSLQSISKKLGGLKYSEVEKDLIQAEEAFLKSGDLESNKVWIEKLLVDYYDPMYFRSLEKREPKILFRGPRDAVVQWLHP